MKITPLIITIFITTLFSQAQDTCSFTSVTISKDDRRLMELSRITEFRCKSSIPQSITKTHGRNETCLVAERYQNGKCVSRELFSTGVLSPPEAGAHKGFISFGWNMDKQRLIGINGSGEFRFPGYVELPKFRESGRGYASFFKSSNPETRIIKENKSTLFPIFAIIGVPTKRARDFSKFSSEQLSSHYKSKKDAVIVYLCFRSGMGHMNLKDVIKDQEAKDNKSNQ